MKGASKSAFHQLYGLFVPKNTAGLAALRLHYLCVHSLSTQQPPLPQWSPFRRVTDGRPNMLFCLGHVNNSGFKRHWCDAVPFVLSSVFPFAVACFEWTCSLHGPHYAFLEGNEEIQKM